MLNIIFSGIGGVLFGALFSSFYHVAKFSNHLSEIKAKVESIEKRLERIENRLEKLEEKK